MPSGVTTGQDRVMPAACFQAQVPVAQVLITQVPGTQVSAKRRTRLWYSPVSRPTGLYHNLVRSEEHTSELQSLMRISYAVFCLKKKKNNIKEKYQATHLA